MFPSMEMDRKEEDLPPGDNPLTSSINDKFAWAAIAMKPTTTEKEEAMLLESNMFFAAEEDLLELKEEPDETAMSPRLTHLPSFSFYKSTDWSLYSQQSLKCSPVAPRPTVVDLAAAGTPIVLSRYEIPDYDIILGEPKAYTLGTRVYRRVRQEYARKRLKPSQLCDFRQKVFAAMCRQAPECRVAPTYWYRSTAPTKIDRGSSVVGHHPESSRSYSWATDQALADDIRNCTKRKRAQFVLGKDLPFEELVSQALSLCDSWVASSRSSDREVRELCAKGFRADIQRIVDEQDRAISTSESSRKALNIDTDALMQIEDLHRHQRERRLVESVHSVWKEMLERHASVAPSGLQVQRAGSCQRMVTKPTKTKASQSVASTAKNPRPPPESLSKSSMPKDDQDEAAAAA